MKEATPLDHAGGNFPNMVLNRREHTLPSPCIHSLVRSVLKQKVQTPTRSMLLLSSVRIDRDVLMSFEDRQDTKDQRIKFFPTREDHHIGYKLDAANDLFEYDLGVGNTTANADSVNNTLKTSSHGTNVLGHLV